ncbi:DUF6443 domain-containing protein [Dyadobacter sandarakinus]|uniref:DUF6443 domain-containing protein n=1 Tax=Dyadobacter sandarakinus TaxID=2747268 RepID=A0ABX7IA21_9BACT|nr:DUF6443 domain-containing protein [Dyadobacter sandarakinus]QRR02377.1 hypothetical protein HWI92_16400 [Dyadobacter sandarakinus]
MKRFYFVFILLLACFPAHSQQTNSRNYILHRTFKQSGAAPDDVSKVVTQVQYFDGLGRPVQRVLVGQSPSGQDLVETSEYDAAGRLFKKYLPYAVSGKGAFQPNAAASGTAWYSANPAGLLGTDLGRPYAETFFEPSALGRVSGQRLPGDKSAASIVKRKVNSANQVNRYDYDVASNKIIQVGQYAPGTLVYLNTTDEQGNVVNEFTDLLGQMICRQVIAAAGSTFRPTTSLMIWACCGAFCSPPTRM